MLTQSEARLAADLLDEASEHYGNHGCNDWTWPAEWTLGAKMLLLDEMELDADSRRQYLVCEYGPPDWMVMAALAKKLRREP